MFQLCASVIDSRMRKTKFSDVVATRERAAEAPRAESAARIPIAQRRSTARRDQRSPPEQTARPGDRSTTTKMTQADDFAIGPAERCRAERLGDAQQHAADEGADHRARGRPARRRSSAFSVHSRPIDGLTE